LVRAGISVFLLWRSDTGDMRSMRPWHVSYKFDDHDFFRVRFSRATALYCILPLQLLLHRHDTEHSETETGNNCGVPMPSPALLDASEHNTISYDSESFWFVCIVSPDLEWRWYTTWPRVELCLDDFKIQRIYGWSESKSKLNIQKGARGERDMDDEWNGWME
jgi:hypothetical protein